MRTTKRIVASVLLAGAALGAFAEAKDALTKQPTQVTLTRGVASDPNQKFPDGQTLEDNAYTRALRDQFNIVIKNDFVASDYVTKVNLAIASGKLPDFLTNVTYAQYKAALKAGLLLDIKGVWDTYASDKTKEVYASNKALFDSLVVKSGKMYAIPTSNPTADFLGVMWVRQDWLDKLKLKAPTTLAELKTVAKAFVEKDPDGNGQADTVGLLGPTVNGQIYQGLQGSGQWNFSYHFDQVFSLFKAYPGIWVKDPKGQVAYGSILPQTKAALAELASMYQAGLINKGIFSEKSEEILSSNKAGLFFGTWWFPFGDLGASWKNDKSANWQPYSLASDGKVYLAKGGNPAANFTIISKNAKNPEAIIKMLNIFKAGLKNYVSEEDQTTMGDGAYPMYMTFSIADGPGMVRKEVNNIFAGKKTQADVTKFFNNYDAYMNQALDKIMVSKTKPYSNENIGGWDFSGDKANDFGWVWSFGVGLRPYADGKFQWVNSLSYERTPGMDKNSAWTSLSKLEYETFSKIITGQAPVSDFDAFVTRWRAEGGESITKEVADSLN